MKENKFKANWQVGLLCSRLLLLVWLAWQWLSGGYGLFQAVHAGALLLLVFLLYEVLVLGHLGGPWYMPRHKNEKEQAKMDQEKERVVPRAQVLRGTIALVGYFLVEGSVISLKPRGLLSFEQTMIFVCVVEGVFALYFKASVFYYFYPNEPQL